MSESQYTAQDIVSQSNQLKHCVTLKLVKKRECITGYNMSYIYDTNARTIDTLSNKKLKCLEFIDSFKLEQDAQKNSQGAQN